MTIAVDVVADSARAAVLMNPVRQEMLRHLGEPSSAAAIARRMDLPRQRVNYHLRELESRELVELVEERRRGSVVERIYRRRGDSFAISPDALGGLGSDPGGVQDRFSAAFLIALASRSIRELGLMQRGAEEEGKRLPTLSLDVDVRFGSAARRNEFAERLTAFVGELAREYHDEEAPRGRDHRLVVGAYPKPKP